MYAKVRVSAARGEASKNLEALQEIVFNVTHLYSDVYLGVDFCPKLITVWILTLLSLPATRTRMLTLLRAPDKRPRVTCER